MLKIQTKKKANLIKCIKCKTKNGKFYCKNCKHIYCQDCGTNHKTSFKDHSILMIKKIKIYLELILK